MIGSLPPALLLMAGALLVPLLRGRARAVYLLLLPAAGCVNLLAVPFGVHWTGHVFDYELVFGRVDKLSFLFGLLFHVATFIAVLYALHVKDTVQQVSALLYAGSALGAVFAGDLITLFIFWELLAVTSVFLIWARRTERAYGAGLRYLMINVVSGLLLLAGIAIHVHAGRGLAFGALPLDGPAAYLILLAFGIKCAFPLLHNWLIDAYPEATPTGTVFLSAFTTKVAIYALARSFAGTEALIYIGTTMTVFPIFYAVIENDLRRVLSYSMVNQLGFMVAGIGLGTPLALNGAVAHAFADVIFKGLLFMAMGAVLQQAGTSKATDLGGLYKTMPLTATFCIVGAASISAFPLFSAFITKSMVLAAAVKEGHIVVWWLLLFASAGVLEHAGIKIPYFAFYAHDSGRRPPEPPRNMLAAMALGAGLCIFIGSYPAALYRLLPFAVDYVPYTTSHVIAQIQLLAFASFGVYFLIRTRVYPPEVRAIHLDFDFFYRRGARAFMALLTGPLARLGGGFETLVLARLPARLARLVGAVHEEERAARGWILGTSVLIAVAMLLGYLLVDYLSG